MAKPAIRKMLDLSTDHLPHNLREDVGAASVAWEGAVVYPIEYGYLVWVPDDPKESSETSDEEVNPPLLALQLYAREYGCDYILFDADGPVNPDLETFDDDDIERVVMTDGEVRR